MAAPTRKTLDSAATIQQSKIVYAKEEEQISKQKGNNKRCREKSKTKNIITHKQQSIQTCITLKYAHTCSKTLYFARDAVDVGCFSNQIPPIFITPFRMGAYKRFITTKIPRRSDILSIGFSRWPF